MQHDDELALRAARGCSQSFEMIYRRHASRIALILKTFSRDHEDLEDLVHDTFCNAISGLGSYRPRGKFRSWLTTIALNTGRKALRDRKRQPQTTMADIESISDSKAHGSNFEHRTLIEDIISRLPMERRLVVILRYWLDYTYDEIADLLEIPAGTARRRMHTALAELRKDVHELEEDRREYLNVRKL